MNECHFIYPMMRYLIWISIFTLFGCHKKNADNNASKKINISLRESREGLLSDVFDSIQYTLLDDDDSIPLVQPYKIIYSGNNIYVEDNFTSNVHIFRKDGNISKVIEAKGKGPGEYFQLDFFQIKTDTIFILDRSLRKILSFNIHGDFISEEKIANNASGFFKYKDRILFFMNNNIDKTPYNFILKEKENVLAAYSPFNPEFLEFHFGMKNGFTESNDGMIFHTLPLSSSVYFFNTDLSLNKIVNFDLGETAVDEIFISEHGSINSDSYMNDLNEKRMVQDISSFFKLGNYYFLSFYQYGKGIHYIILNKDLKLISQNITFENDIDGMKIRNIPWTFDDNKIVIKMNSIDFYYDYLEKFSDKDLSVRDGSLHDFFEKTKTKLQDDQTVLVSMTLRNDLGNNK